MENVALDLIQVSKTNPRGAIDPRSLVELTTSIRQYGVLQPILLRELASEKLSPKARRAGIRYEVVAGHRRYLAAQAAGLEDIPAIVRQLSEVQALEVQLIENLQREDLHPLEEAEGYRRLTSVGYDVAKIAERTHRSVKYVYDRIKLLELTPKARRLFLSGVLTPGHAILLARLKPKDQDRALELGEVLHHEQLLWNPDDGIRGEREESLKAVSVRELDAWIAEHVRFEVAAPDPMLFPETVQVLEGADKVVPITRSHFIPEAAREGRTWGPQSWRRADGLKKSKKCEHAITGVVAVGPGRGEAFKVCTAKEKCAIHWAREIRGRARNAAARAKAGGSPSSPEAGMQRRQQQRKADEDAREQRHIRWKKALPAILEAVAERIKKAPAGANGALAAIVMKAVTGYHSGAAGAEGLVPRGSTAEDLVRHAAMTALRFQAHAWGAAEEFPRRIKALGIDVAKILIQVAPVQTSAKKSGAKSKPKRTRRKKAGRR